MKFIFFTLFLTFSTIAVGQNDNCKKKIHEGTFLSPDKGFEDYRIVRTKNSQIEYINHGEVRIHADIKWISEDSYKLTITKRVNFPEEAIPENDVLIFKVIECKGDSHTLETYYNDERIVFKLLKKE